MAIEALSVHGTEKSDRVDQERLVRVQTIDREINLWQTPIKDVIKLLKKLNAEDPTATVSIGSRDYGDHTYLEVSTTREVPLSDIEKKEILKKRRAREQKMKSNWKLLQRVRARSLKSKGAEHAR